MFYNIKTPYICTVFFMVLDLRLTMKIGCRDDNLFLLYTFSFIADTKKGEITSSFLLYKSLFKLICPIQQLVHPIWHPPF